MQKTVLVPLDGSSLAEAALPMAHVVAATLGDELELLRVVHEPDEAADARGYLESVALNGSVLTNVATGVPADQIVARARQPDLEMVVMSSHRRVGLPRAVLGSVAQHVVAHSPRPTLLTHAPRTSELRLRKILVPVDATLASPWRWISALACGSGAEVLLLGVVPPDELYCWKQDSGAVLPEPDAVVAVRERLNDLASSLCGRGIRASVHVEIGPPSETITSVANRRGVELIAMITHARTATLRMLLGSVADAVARTAQQPVLLVRLPTGI
jgi:nucleotide-binding universal stress UspA family protein